MGDTYAIALSKSVKHLRPIAINLSENRLSCKGVSELLACLSPHTKHIDFSNNSIGSEGIKSFKVYLDTKAES